ncbi:hypothetical protein N657DRAFT_658777 [Parathielavia appendiculata]|uniref:HD domain-containing protein n=1 Tax=Parathielavia appendiculata TaxID=2587402 RepID=A0AAN6TS99_9PEZI|nr:hypothetical protein N657DRAFT_658777 [Parathielavia appendiculata]
MLAIRFTWLALIGACISFSAHATPLFGPRGSDRHPRRIIAGVSVIDTPIVQAARQYAREHCDDNIYGHVMRSWLFGTLMLQHNSTLETLVDPEVHAVALILHDLGWERTPNSTIVTPDHRFEVDGAIAARKFIRGHHHGRRWEERRVQLVWDAIALHAERKIAFFKEAEVEAVSKGILLDFVGPDLGVPEDKYAAVVEAFPKSDFKNGVIEVFSWLCRTKPETTYDTFMQPYGELFVPGYSAVGHRMVDRVLGMSGN